MVKFCNLQNPITFISYCKIGFCYAVRQHLTQLGFTSIDIYKNKYLSKMLRIGIVSDIIIAHPETYLLGVFVNGEKL